MNIVVSQELHFKGPTDSEQEGGNGSEDVKASLARVQQWEENWANIRSTILHILRTPGDKKEKIDPKRYMAIPQIINSYCTSKKGLEYARGRRGMGSNERNLYDALHNLLQSYLTDLRTVTPVCYSKRKKTSLKYAFIAL